MTYRPATLATRLLALVAVLAFAACSGGDGNGGGDPTDPGNPSCAEGTESYDSTFAGIQTKIFERHGCTTDACHGTAKSGGLDLTPANAYASIYGVRATSSALARVEPGDEERSFLWLKLAAATRPGQYQIAGSPMPSGQAPLSEDELELMRLWIYAGAPETGVVNGSEKLLGACLPEPKPLVIEPLAAPAPGVGFQLTMPEWDLKAESEYEGCMAVYYDVTDQVPAEFRDPSGTMFRFSATEVRQDPQSHHVFLYYPEANFAEGGVDVTAPEFGQWTCRGGSAAGNACDPKAASDCTAGGGVCASELTKSLGCVGYGPRSAGNMVLIGGAGQPVYRTDYLAGVFAQLPMKGVFYWNSHAFNLTKTDGVMHVQHNWEFAHDQRNTITPITDFSAIFRPNAPPYTRESYCNDHVLPRGARLFNLNTHTHKRGKRTWITLPDGTMVYENFSYTDPVQGRWDPPLAFDSTDPKERTLRYCGTYENGIDADGNPDPSQVTRLSRVSVTAAGQIGGTCKPVACTAGRVGAACNGADDDASCDSSPGAGDGECDACPITGGESTENEMFNLFGLFYVDPTIAAQDAAAGVATVEQQEALQVDANGRSLSTAVVVPAGGACAMARPSVNGAMQVGVVPANDGPAGHAQ
jgi:hypothetical protein